MSKIVEFDRSKLVKKEIMPLINQLVNVCTMNKIPMFLSVCTSNTAENTAYYNDGVMPGSMQIGLADDQITQHLLISRGFKAKDLGDEIEVMFPDDPAMDEPDE